ncbi:DUF6868 family protein [Desulfonatronum sp. SC1]|uniref:DUF6868 family protein n=1 Tax=Desulfonatronum sp. SC1 TaxID=2109626 RepID=UPI000D30A40D|nr:hypothetical protein [Desulfonatronum sp. SC1]PTN38944.1 hypothetical protein C6366_00445 [Desulfonatronum sp. SC1]
MNIDLLTQFFMWCTILNVAFLVLSFLVVAFGFGGDFVYRMHGKFFPMPRETFNAVIYSFIGMYKIFVFVFNIVPWIALTIIG